MMRGQWSYDAGEYIGTDLHMDERALERSLQKDMEKAAGGRPLDLKFTWAWEGSKRILVAEGN